MFPSLMKSVSNYHMLPVYIVYTLSIAQVDLLKYKSPHNTRMYTKSIPQIRHQIQSAPKTKCVLQSAEPYQTAVI